MKLTNPNYCCTVVTIKNIIPLEGCDNVVAVQFFGQNAIVSKDIKLGDVGLFFTSEVELGDKYCKNNNLYRHSELNSNTELKGYIEDSRRVKAIKFRGHKSSGLFMPLSSLYYLGVLELKDGDVFNEIGGEVIADKYFVPTINTNNVKGLNKKEDRIDVKQFPEHLDSIQFRRANYNPMDYITVTQKLHGSSARLGNVLVKKKLSLLDKISKYLGVNINEYEYDNIYASRRVIKNGGFENVDSKGFYNNDIWKLVNDKYKSVIPQNRILYGEIIGWDNEKPIQKNYTYNLPKGELEFYCYRISVINEKGISIDLSYKAMQEFCKNNGVPIVPLLWEGYYKDFNVDERMDKDYSNIGGVPLCKESKGIDEGVIIRSEGITPFLTKAKCQSFLISESKLLDDGVIDTETQENI